MSSWPVWTLTGAHTCVHIHITHTQLTSKTLTIKPNHQLCSCLGQTLSHLGSNSSACADSLLNRLVVEGTLPGTSCCCFPRNVTPCDQPPCFYLPCNGTRKGPVCSALDHHMSEYVSCLHSSGWGGLLCLKTKISLSDGNTGTMGSLHADFLSMSSV